MPAEDRIGKIIIFVEFELYSCPLEQYKAYMQERWCLLDCVIPCEV